MGLFKKPLKIKGLRSCSVTKPVTVKRLRAFWKDISENNLQTEAYNGINLLIWEQI